MPILYLIRHPHTEIDLSAPAHTWSLSDAGRAQLDALRAASFWPLVSAIYSSSERKARYPAEQIAAFNGLPVTSLDALGELDRSAYTAPDTASYEATVAEFFARPAASVQGWETADAALARFSTGITALGIHHTADESLAVITHGLVLTLYAAHLRDAAPTLDRWRALDFAAIMAVDRATLRPLTDFLPPPYSALPLP